MNDRISYQDQFAIVSTFSELVATGFQGRRMLCAGGEIWKVIFRKLC